MKKIVRISGVATIALLYCFAISLIKSAPSDSRHLLMQEIAVEKETSSSLNFSTDLFYPYHISHFESSERSSGEALSIAFINFPRHIAFTPNIVGKLCLKVYANHIHLLRKLLFIFPFHYFW